MWCSHLGHLNCPRQGGFFMAADNATSFPGFVAELGSTLPPKDFTP